MLVIKIHFPTGFVPKTFQIQVGMLWPLNYGKPEWWTYGCFKKKALRSFSFKQRCPLYLGSNISFILFSYINLFFVNCFMCNKVVVVDCLHSWVLVFGQMFKQIVSSRWCYTRRFAMTIFSATQCCDIVATLFWIVTTLFQHCKAVLRHIKREEASLLVGVAQRCLCLSFLFNPHPISSNNTTWSNRWGMRINEMITKDDQYLTSCKQ